MYRLFLVLQLCCLYIGATTAFYSPEDLLSASANCQISPTVDGIDDPLSIQGPMGGSLTADGRVKISDCMSSFLTDPSMYHTVHKLIDDSIVGYLRTKLNNATAGQSENCVAFDAWATSCGVSSKILSELIFLNSTYGKYGVFVCPNAVQIAYAGFGTLHLSFHLHTRSCPPIYQVIINHDTEHAKFVCAETLSKMIQNMVSLTRISRTIKHADECTCHPVEHILLDVASGIFYSNNSIFFISHPIIVLDGKRSLNLLMDQDYIYKIPSVNVESPCFLQTFLNISGSALYFDTIKSISFDGDAPLIKANDFFFIKRNEDRRIGFYVSQPLAASNGISPFISYERPACELEDVTIDPRKFCIHACLKDKPDARISVYTSATRKNRKMLSLLTKVL